MTKCSAMNFGQPLLPCSDIGLLSHVPQSAFTTRKKWKLNIIEILKIVIVAEMKVLNLGLECMGNWGGLQVLILHFVSFLRFACICVSLKNYVCRCFNWL